MNHRLKKNARLNAELRQTIATAAVEHALDDALKAIREREFDLFEAVATAYCEAHGVTLEEARDFSPGVLLRVTCLQLPFGRTDYRVHRNLNAQDDQFAPLPAAIRKYGASEAGDSIELGSFARLLDSELRAEAEKFDLDRHELATERAQRIRKAVAFMQQFTSVGPLLEKAPQLAQFVPAEMFDEPEAQVTLDELMGVAA